MLCYSSFSTACMTIVYQVNKKIYIDLLCYLTLPTKIMLKCKDCSSLLKKVFLVTLNRNDWTFSKCSCYSFGKFYICSHINTVAIHQKLCFIPQHIIEKQRIETLAKRRRKPKATIKHCQENEIIVIGYNWYKQKS